MALVRWSGVRCEEPVWAVDVDAGRPVGRGACGAAGGARGCAERPRGLQVHEEATAALAAITGGGLDLPP